jgi:CheY-like chemotaxis protein
MRTVACVSWSVSPEGLLDIKWVEENRKTGRPKGLPRRGFGSTLLNRVVEQQLGGSISRRFDGGGLYCEITIPLAQSDQFAGPQQRAQEQPVSREDAPPRSGVLIVEDEALVAMDLESMFESLGYEIFATASSVKNALAALEKGTPQLAIVDMNLSGDSSLPIADALSKRGVPFVFATGYAELGEMPPHLADVPHLSKPISEKNLMRTIAQLSSQALSLPSKAAARAEGED